NRRRQDLLRKKTELAVGRRARPDALLEPAVERDVAHWEEGRADAPGAWTVLVPETLVSKEGSTLVPQADGSILSTGPRPATDTYTVTVRPGSRRVTAVRLEVLTVDDHPYKGPGRQDNGNFHLSEFRLLRTRGDETKAVVLQNPSA